MARGRAGREGRGGRWLALGSRHRITDLTGLERSDRTVCRFQVTGNHHDPAILAPLQVAPLVTLHDDPLCVVGALQVSRDDEDHSWLDHVGIRSNDLPVRVVDHMPISDLVLVGDRREGVTGLDGVCPWLGFRWRLDRCLEV